MSEIYNLSVINHNVSDTRGLESVLSCRTGSCDYNTGIRVNMVIISNSSRQHLKFSRRSLFVNFVNAQYLKLQPKRYTRCFQPFSLANRRTPRVIGRPRSEAYRSTVFPTLVNMRITSNIKGLGLSNLKIAIQSYKFIF